MKFTFIGNGKMAQSLISALIENFEIEVVGRDFKALEKLKRNKFEKIDIFNIENFDIEDRNIILCVKPNSLESVSEKLKGKANTLFSVLAGVSIEKIHSKIKADSYIRFMPNLGAKYLKSTTSVTGDLKLKDLALQIARSIGDAIWLDSENELDIATALAGSGPAYLALIAEALSDGAVKEGLKRKDADTIVANLFKSFAPLIENETSLNIKNSTMSPAGTTAYGLFELENSNVRASFIKAINSAYNRAKKLR